MAFDNPSVSAKTHPSLRPLALLCEAFIEIDNSLANNQHLSEAEFAMRSAITNAAFKLIAAQLPHEDCDRQQADALRAFYFGEELK